MSTASSRRYWFPKPYADFVQRLRVASGFGLTLAFAWLAQPTPASLAAGLPIALTGLLLRGWAAGCLYKNQQLAQGGPYAYLRNPLYLGTLIVAAGLAAATRRWELALLFALAFGLIYFPTIELEEQHLRELFPRYPEYAARVPLLLPRWTPGAQGPGFTWAQYRKNQEYNASLGFLLGAAFLVFRAS